MTARLATSRFSDVDAIHDWLDGLLKPVLESMIASNGAESINDPYRGLYISDSDVRDTFYSSELNQILKFRPAIDGLSQLLGEDSRLSQLQHRLGLSNFDLEVVGIALAVEIDLRYERIFAYLQDDVTRKLPSVDLALSLLCETVEERLQRRQHLTSDTVLARYRILEVVADPAQVAPPLLRHSLKLDNHIVEYLLGSSGLDYRLRSFCSLQHPLNEQQLLQPEPDRWRYIVNRVALSCEAGKPGTLIFSGPSASDKRQAAASLAAALAKMVINVDLDLLDSNTDLGDEMAARLLREAALHDAVIVIAGLDARERESISDSSSRSGHVKSFVSAISRRLTGIVILLLEDHLPRITSATGMQIEVPFVPPNYVQRRQHLLHEVQQSGASISADEATAFASRFQLTAEEIAGAVRLAIVYSREEQALNGNGNLGSPSVTIDCADLSAAARSLTPLDIDTAINCIDALFTWEDIVLPHSTMNQLREICSRIRVRYLVMEEWGFDRKLSTGKGAPVLFAGPPGTGKTMASEVIANDLGLSLFKVDLSGVVSKYIGETEKNLHRIFTAAGRSNAILLFDEADALFGKRSEVRDSHDRYANIEISFLLQMMEEYDGLAILATNLRRNMDDAFVRRLAYAVSFSLPNEQDRLRIWQVIWPPETPRSDDLDLEFMARQFKLAGGNIKNIALAAAFYAAERYQPVAMRHLILATKREYQKMNKIVVEGDFGVYGHFAAEPEGAG